METFSVLLVLCAGNSPVTGEFPSQRPVTRSFDVFFDLCLHKPLSKQLWGWRFETLSRPLWRHRNACTCIIQGCFAGTGTIVWLPQWHWRNPGRYRKTEWINHNKIQRTNHMRSSLVYYNLFRWHELNFKRFWLLMHLSGFVIENAELFFEKHLTWNPSRE